MPMSTLVAALAPGIERKNLVARLTLSGLVTLAERVAIHDRLAEHLANDIRWLDLRMTDLYCRPTDHDLAEIDAHGVLRDAASLTAAGDRVVATLTAVEGIDTVAAHEVRNLATVGRALVAAALAREESRGAHTRSDFPDRSDALRLRFVVV